MARSNQGADDHFVAAPAVKQAIAGFHQDDQGHWVAELACGHNQHVRHDPPWQVRTWVLTEEGRRTRIGEMLNCVLCDEAKDKP